jgi:ABC-type transport system involved in cytochrome c biogenesis permease component
MKPGWQAILHKELVSEIRQQSGLVTTALFAVFTVVTISFATYDLQISPQLGAGLLSVALLFAAIVALPRVVLIEDEQGTGDLLRLLAKPEDVFWGKALYNLGFMLLTAILVTTLFLGFTHTKIAIPWLLAVCTIGSCAAYAGTVTLCGALVSHATNRSALAGVLSVPLLLPLSFLAVSGLRVALNLEGNFDVAKGVIAGTGLLCYGLATLALGPYLFAAVWKR